MTAKCNLWFKFVCYFKMNSIYNDNNLSNCRVVVEDVLPNLNVICYTDRDIGDGISVNANKCTINRCIELCTRFHPSCRV